MYGTGLSVLLNTDERRVPQDPTQTGRNRESVIERDGQEENKRRHLLLMAALV